jgi:hypothetical protein
VVGLQQRADHGQVGIGTDGGFTYDPDPGFAGTDTFTYEMTNGDGDTDTATVSVEVVEATATVETTADVDDDGATDEITVRSEPDQQIRGTSNLPPGTDIGVRLTGTDSGSPFVKPLETTIDADGDWTVSADFSDVTAGANFTVDVRRQGQSLLENPVDGRIVAPPTASVTFEAQQSNGRTVTVSSVTTNEGGFVTILREGTVIGSSEYLDPGTTTAVDIALDDPLETNRTLRAIVRRDANDNRTLDGVSTDPRYRNGSELVASEARITVGPRRSTNVSLSPLSAPDSAELGDTITVTVTVTNPAADSVTVPVNYTFNGSVQQTRTVSVGADASRNVSFDVTFQTPAPSVYSHGVAVGEQTVTDEITLNSESGTSDSDGLETDTGTETDMQIETDLSTATTMATGTDLRTGTDVDAETDMRTEVDGINGTDALDPDDETVPDGNETVGGADLETTTETGPGYGVLPVLAALCTIVSFILRRSDGGLTDMLLGDDEG